MDNTDKDALLKRWQDLPIKKHLFITENYIVFMNTDNEIDWKIDYKEEVSYNEIEFNRLVNMSEQIATQNINISNEKINKRFHQILGSGIAKLCEYDYTNAEKSFEQAQSYIVEKNYEITRIWKLQSTSLSALIIGSIAFILNNRYSGDDDNIKLFIYSLFGSLGVFLSTFINLKNICYNIETGRCNIYFESFVRVIAGIIISFIGLLAIKHNLILSPINEINAKNIEILFAILLAPSQNLIPSLFYKFDKLEKKNDQ
ncbi:MAG: hypothetical protein LBG80_17205 [Bacteroidales bacterium]|jgi:hypothetical protein|nr:hypothetical protein [Bacteroidales bacterium]